MLEHHVLRERRGDGALRVVDVAESARMRATDHLPQLGRKYGPRKPTGTAEEPAAATVDGAGPIAWARLSAGYTRLELERVADRTEHREGH